MKNAIELLHAEIERCWVAAGKPAGSTEMCLWEMTRHIDNAGQTMSGEDLLSEGIDLLDAWIDLAGHIPSPAETQAREAAKQALLTM
jgi:hypothetical protein